MTRSSVLVVLVSFASLLFGQADWQGTVKKLYPVNIPPFQGFVPVFGVAQKTAKLPDIELYSLSMKLASLKAPVDFYRTALEGQGFKSVKASSTPTTEKVEMVNSARKITAVVVASKQTAQTMLVGVTVLPEGRLPK